MTTARCSGRPCPRCACRPPCAAYVPPHPSCVSSSPISPLISGTTAPPFRTTEFWRHRHVRVCGRTTIERASSSSPSSPSTSLAEASSSRISLERLLLFCYRSSCPKGGPLLPPLRCPPLPPLGSHDCAARCPSLPPFLRSRRHRHHHHRPLPRTTRGHRTATSPWTVGRCRSPTVRRRTTMTRRRSPPYGRPRRRARRPQRGGGGAAPESASGGEETPEAKEKGGRVAACILVRPSPQPRPQPQPRCRYRNAQGTVPPRGAPPPRGLLSLFLCGGALPLRRTTRTASG
mmetsp:Transcript_38146/g.114039  ORF Transcript_38146/g.114039 Transcript_38146/m.114039 type:complete len:289 (-) Transcript_38146:268-1134(-)